MVATKRKSLIPKNYASMTDAEHYAWVDSLSEADYDKLADRTIKGSPEWFVYFESKTDDKGRDLLETWSTLEDAMKQYNELAADPETLAVEVEEVVGHYGVIDRDLKDRDYATVAKFGEFSE